MSNEEERKTMERFERELCGMVDEISGVEKGIKKDLAKKQPSRAATIGWGCALIGVGFLAGVVASEAYNESQKEPLNNLMQYDTNNGELNPSELREAEKKYYLMPKPEPLYGGKK